MARGRARVALSDQTRSLRLTARMVMLCCLILLVVAFAGGKGWIPPAFGAAALPLFLAAALVAMWLSAKAHRQALADREMESGRAMIVAIAAQLGRQDDAKLAQIAARGGPAGEAATMILRGRAEKKTASPHTPPPP